MSGEFDRFRDARDKLVRDLREAGMGSREAERKAVEVAQRSDRRRRDRGEGNPR